MVPEHYITARQQKPAVRHDSEQMITKLIPGNRIFPKATVEVDGTESSYTTSQSPISSNFPCDEQWTANDANTTNMNQSQSNFTI